ncbi:hypothetical protein PABG_00933 [Paracoccidioides brasiliensis Pb03]|nr:hypothetical protein PABG_00933 [Paracoccidioides brasiliensis Pb03]
MEEHIGHCCTRLRCCHFFNLPQNSVPVSPSRRGYLQSSSWFKSHGIPSYRPAEDPRLLLASRTTPTEGIDTGARVSGHDKVGHGPTEVGADAWIDDECPTVQDATVRRRNVTAYEISNTRQGAAPPHLKSAKALARDNGNAKEDFMVYG